MTFGKSIRKLRKANGLTQRSLAEEVGVDFTYISKIENDRLDHTPSIKTIRKLAEALHADELELMERANKLPAVLGPIAEDEDARKFFRRAAQTIKSPEGWRDLMDYLENRASRGDDHL